MSRFSPLARILLPAAGVAAVLAAGIAAYRHFGASLPQRETPSSNVSKMTSTGEDIPVSEAIARMETIQLYLTNQNFKLINYMRTRVADSIQRHGMSDAEEAASLGGGGRYPTCFLIPTPPADIDLYGKNLYPLDQSLGYLRHGIVHGARGIPPTHVRRADLDLLDKEVAELLAVESQVMHLIDRWIDLAGQHARVRTQMIASWNDHGKYWFRAEDPTPLSAEENALLEQNRAFCDQEMSLRDEYRSMKTQFITELGTYGPDHPGPPGVETSKFPETAVGD